MQDIKQIYEEYFETVNKYLFCLTHDNDISEELTQETFYNAIKGIKNFRNECSVSVWLCQIAKNKWKDYLKNKKYETIPLNDNLEFLMSEENFEEKISSREELINFYEKVHNLDINTREVIYLKIKGEFTFKEIGKILGKNEEWARITFYRGKLKLKEEFKNEK